MARSQMSSQGHRPLGVSASAPVLRTATSWLPALRPPTGVSGPVRDVLRAQRPRSSHPTSKEEFGFDYDGRDTLASTATTLNLGGTVTTLGATQPSFGGSTLGTAWRQHSRIGSKRSQLSAKMPALVDGRRSVSESALDRRPVRNISTAARRQNSRSERGLRNVAQLPQPGGGLLHLPAASHDLRSSTLLEAHDLSRHLDADSLTRSITNLQKALGSFDLRPPGARAPSGDAEGRGGGGGGEEEHEKLAERIEAYKMCRRIEPELVPLDHSSLEPVQRGPIEKQEMVERNRGEESLQVWLPDKRKARIKVISEERDARREAVAAQRREREEATELTLAEALRRKQLQGEAALVAKRAPKPQVSAKVQKALDQQAQSWCMLFTALSFAKHFEQALAEGRKHARHEKYCGLLHRAVKSLAFRDANEKKKRIDGAGIQEGELTRRFELVARMWKTKYGINARRRDAHIIHTMLNRTGNPLGVAFRQLRRIVIHTNQIQDWWRSCLRRLRITRQQLEHRWIALEEDLILREHKGKGGDGKHATQRRSHSKERAHSKDGEPRRRSKLSQHLRAEMVPEAVRTKFLANELRVRRFAMLPQIDVWREDLRRWRDNMERLREQKEALLVINAAASSDAITSMFTWPPVRPSHLPSAHLASERDGGPCPPWCCGRKGDQEILEWIKKARVSGQECRRVQRRRDSALGMRRVSVVVTEAAAQEAASAAARGDRRRNTQPKAKSIMKDAGVDLDAPGAAARRKPEAAATFDLADEEDLRQWGVAEDAIALGPAFDRPPDGVEVVAV